MIQMDGSPIPVFKKKNSNPDHLRFSCGNCLMNWLKQPKTIQK